MEERVLIGRGKQMINFPRRSWEEHLAQAPEHTEKRLQFMSDDHHLVRYFAVRELVKRGRPITPNEISRDLQIDLEHALSILEDLEKHLFFLVRNDAGDVVWAFPVTFETTPHQLIFRSGEQLYAAWAEDAIAAPFVQGYLIGEKATALVKTSCVQTNRALEIEIDSDLNMNLMGGDADPLVFSPTIHWAGFKEPSIIHAFWQNSVFFWSEEHAREYRRMNEQVDGIYLTLEQMAYSTPIVQGGLFAFR